jgi:hypothetical protein
VAVLDPNLAWIDAIPLSDRYNILRVKNDEIFLLGPGDRAGRLLRVDGRWEVEQIQKNAKLMTAPSKAGAEIKLSGVRESDMAFQLIGTYFGSEPEEVAFEWQLYTQRSTRGVALAIPEFVRSCIFLRLTYLAGANSFDSNIAVIENDGNIRSSIQIPTSIGTDYRMPISTKVGLDGSVVTVRVFSEFTEVSKWNW